MRVNRKTAPIRRLPAKDNWPRENFFPKNYPTPPYHFVISIATRGVLSRLTYGTIYTTINPSIGSRSLGSLNLKPTAVKNSLYFSLNQRSETRGSEYDSEIRTRGYILLINVPYAFFSRIVRKSKIKCTWYHAKPNFVTFTLVYCKVGGA